MADFCIEPFDPAKHQRATFDCGRPTLNKSCGARHAVRETPAGQDPRRRACRAAGRRCRLLHPRGRLASVPTLPPEIARKLPRHPVPVVLLARLAVDRSFQGRGVGKTLLMDAMCRALGISTLLGVFAVEVVAIDERAAGFYAKFGFSPLLDDPQRMYLPISVAEQAVAAAERQSGKS